jgi:hypothetical protein
MKLLYALLLVLALTGCGNRTKSAQPASTDTTAMATTALTSIYSDVFGWYTKAESDPSLTDNDPNFEDRYMSANYKKVLRQVEEKDKKLTAEGFVGFFDYDHWVCGQDYQHPSMRIVSMKVTALARCHAEVDISNLGTKTRVGIDLVLENGDWKIDDFHTNGTSELARMNEYLTGN